MKFGKEFQERKDQILSAYQELAVLTDADFINYKQLKKLIKVVKSHESAEKSLRYFYENEVRNYAQKLYSLEEELGHVPDKKTIISLFQKLNETANYKICKKINKNFDFDWDHEAVLYLMSERVLTVSRGVNYRKKDRANSAIQENILLLDNLQSNLELSFLSQRNVFILSIVVCLIYIFCKAFEILSWEWYNRTVGDGDSYPFSIETVVWARAVILFFGLSVISGDFTSLKNVPRAVLLKVAGARALYVVGDVMIPLAIAMLSSGVYSVFQTLSIPIIVIIRYFLMHEGLSKSHIIFIGILLLGLLGFRGNSFSDASSTFINGTFLVLGQVFLHSLSKVLIEKYAKQDLETLNLTKPKKFQILYCCDMLIATLICFSYRFDLVTTNLFQGWTWHTGVILAVSIFSNFSNNLCLIITTALINVLTKTVAITLVFFAGIGIFNEATSLQEIVFAIVVFVAAIAYQSETQQKIKRKFKHKGQMLARQRTAMIELLDQIDSQKIGNSSDSESDADSDADVEVSAWQTKSNI